METRLAQHAGFCFGVRRAVDTVYEQVKTGKTIYTYGPIVHNEEVIRELEKLGVKTIKSRQDLETLSSGIVIVRAHGAPPDVFRLLEEKGIQCVDATCPFVKRIHRIVEREKAEGKHIVVVGDARHPEVEGIVGRCAGDVTVLEEPEDAERFVPPQGKKLCVVAQTTYNYNKFHYIVEIFEKKGYNSSTVNTICNATQERQQAAGELASVADVMIVIGGKHSSNTRKLYDICKKECAQTYFIQTLDDLHMELPESVRLVGITAGASTPNKIIEEVQNYVRINF